jgi:hypothetical protein
MKPLIRQTLGNMAAILNLLPYISGALLGVSCIYLSIPLIGVLKLIFNRIYELKPWG